MNRTWKTGTAATFEHGITFKNVLGFYWKNYMYKTDNMQAQSKVFTQESNKITATAAFSTQASTPHHAPVIQTPSSPDRTILSTCSS